VDNVLSSFKWALGADSPGCEEVSVKKLWGRTPRTHGAHMWHGHTGHTNIHAITSNSGPSNRHSRPPPPPPSHSAPGHPKPGPCLDRGSTVPSAIDPWPCPRRPRPQEQGQQRWSRAWSGGTQTHCDKHAAHGYWRYPGCHWAVRVPPYVCWLLEDGGLAWASKSKCTLN
jgi:hypothetical protein